VGGIVKLRGASIQHMWLVINGAALAKMVGQLGNLPVETK